MIEIEINLRPPILELDPLYDIVDQDNVLHT